MQQTYFCPLFQLYTTILSVVTKRERANQSSIFILLVSRFCRLQNYAYGGHIYIMKMNIFTSSYNAYTAATNQYNQDSQYYSDKVGFALHSNVKTRLQFLYSSNIVYMTDIYTVLGLTNCDDKTLHDLILGRLRLIIKNSAYAGHQVPQGTCLSLCRPGYS